MQLIQCTKKLQKEMGLKQHELSSEEPEAHGLGSWHANLIHVDRRKCILFVNDQTLFNLIAADVSRTQIKELASLFRSYLPCILSGEGIEEPVKNKILSEYEDISYSNTSSKSVLGSMNDLAFHYKYHIIEAGGIHSWEVPSIISRLNHMPMGAIKYAYSVDALRSVYENAI